MKNKSEIKKPVKQGYAKVPVVIQMEALECGAACLAMVLAYYGRWVPLERMRSDCGVSRDGSNARNVLRAARGYGLSADGYRFQPAELQKRGGFPCILHWNFNHFVVLCGFHRGKAVINDPARGTVFVPWEEFDRAFTGVCMLFEPTEAFEPGGEPDSVLDFARKRLKGMRTPILFVVFTTILTSVIGVVNPAFSRFFLDRLVGDPEAPLLAPFILLMLAFAVLRIAVSLVQTLEMLKIEGRLAVLSNAGFMWHILRLPMEFYAQRMAGDISQRQSSNEQVASSLINTLAPLALNFVMLIVYLTVMLRYSLALTAVGVASIALNALTARLISRKRIAISRVQMRDGGKLAAATVSGIEMIETIKASGAEAGYFRRWAGYQASVNSAAVRFSRINQYLGSVPAVASGVANAAVLMLGVWLTTQGRFTAGMILAFQGFMAAFSAPAHSLIGAGQTLQEMRTNMERIQDVTRYQPDVTYEAAPGADGAVFAKLSGDIELRNVTFGYSRLAPPLIENFSVKLSQGQRIAFVGPSGCGKSTLAKLISGLYEPWSGEILFDGKPRKAYPREVLTSSIAVVDQEIILFEDSVRNNIKMWDASIEDYEMILAARDAQIHADIMKREGGYDHKILSGGRNWSGGQRQRLEIARVLAQDPTIVILDEATSALDAQTERGVVQSINDRGVTSIVVAHRLSTIRDSDEIVVLDQGKVAERGTHEELFARGGLYTKLVSNE